MSNEPPPGAPPPGHQHPPPAYQYPPPGYGYPYYQPPIPPRPYNSMSIAAMVVGLVGACNPLGILALIFGMIAKRQIRETGEQGDGFAVTGIVMGWIGVASVIFWALYLLAFFSIWIPFVEEVSDPANWPTADPTDLPSWIAPRP